MSLALRSRWEDYVPEQRVREWQIWDRNGLTPVEQFQVCVEHSVVSIYTAPQVVQRRTAHKKKQMPA